MYYDYTNLDKILGILPRKNKENVFSLEKKYYYP